MSINNNIKRHQQPKLQSLPQKRHLLKTTPFDLNKQNDPSRIDLELLGRQFGVSGESTYQPKMGMVFKEASDYFQRVESPEVLNERIYWIRNYQSNHVFIDDERNEAKPAILELADYLGYSKLIAKEEFLYQKLCRLSENVECDLLFVSRETGKIIAEAVCFPSMWDPEEKIGKTVEEAHDIIPNLNKSPVGNSITKFLKMDNKNFIYPNIYQRANVGIVQTNELNQHPKRYLSKLIVASTSYVRIEEQALTVLPKSNVILFGLRIKHVAIREFPLYKKELANMLATMSDEMLAYKGIKTKELKEQLIAELMAD